MQSLEPHSPGDDRPESPFESINDDEIPTSSQNSIHSNSNNYEGDSQQQCLSPIRVQHKHSASLQKQVNFQVIAPTPPPLKKVQSVNEKHMAKTAEKKIDQSPVKLAKSTSGISPIKKFSIKGVDFPLFEGEDLLAREECLMLVGSERANGFIVITNYRIFFLQNGSYLLHIPVGFVAGVDRQVEQKPVIWSKVEITTKFGKLLRFRFNSTPQTSNQVYKILKKYSSGDITTLFAFAYARYYIPKSNLDLTDQTKERSAGWEMDMVQDYERMGVTFDEASLFKKVSNVGGKLCLSYPPQFVVTKRVKDETLGKCLKARIRERVPVLSYFHSDPKTKKVSCLWRAALCRSNVTSTARNFGDEEYVKSLALEQNKQKSLMLLVYDVKPKTNAITIFYQNSLVKPVNDLHSLLLMRQSFNKIASSYESDVSTKWVNNIEDSKWFEQIWKLLFYAEDIALKMKNGNPILVQCLDGTDRSSQLCALAQLILCPHYRTIKGFQTLMNKQFVWLGYPFAQRLRGTDEERVPTLIQFLDCVHQLTIAFPLSFQFNSKYLSSLAQSLYNNKYGNFLTNSFTQFSNKNISQFSLSFWSKPPREIQKNSYFKKSYLPLQTLTPIPPLKSMRVWHQFLQTLGGTRTKRDLYKIHPNAETNQDYLTLQHENLKHQNSQFKVLVDQQKSRISELQKHLSTLEAQEDIPSEPA